MDLTAPTGTSVAGDTSGQQRVGESHSVAVNSDHSIAFRLVEQFDHSVDSVVCRHREELDRRVSGARGYQQYVSGLLVETPDADLHEFGERCRQLRIVASGHII